jgi:hypothetical protein
MGKHDNLPPGVTVGMLPGNTSNDVAWEKFEEWALNELTTGNLTIEEAYMSIRAGLAAVKAIRNDVSTMIGEVRQDERMAYEKEKSHEQDDKERERQEKREAASALFHRLWTEHVGTEGYVKEDWMKISTLIGL